MLAHPPRPRFALTIGVVGHRPNRLPEHVRGAVVARIGEVLDVLRAATLAALDRNAAEFAPEPPRLLLLSSLAEGADRIVTDAALDRGFDLTAVLPFAVDEYEADFATDATRADYRRLLARGSALELPGTRDDEARAYETAGRMLVDGSDLIIAVWDGGESAGRGGTTELVQRAAAEGVPILHVDAAGGVPARLLWSGFDDWPLAHAAVADLPAMPLERAPELIERTLCPPRVVRETGKLRRFLAETWRPRNMRLEVPLLLALLGLRLPRRTDHRPDSPDAPAARFARYANGASAGGGDAGGAAQAALDTAAQAYGWADALGVRYAQVFRGAYTLNFILAAFAVSMAVLPLLVEGLGWHKWPFVVVEVAFVLTIIVNTAAGRHHDWHSRWLEAREVAERLRAALPLWLLGGRVRGTVAATWTDWYASAHCRALGVNGGPFDDARLVASRQALRAVVADQQAYHTATAVDLRRIERRIARIGEACFASTLLAALAYLGATLAGVHVTEFWGHLVTAATAGLPAFGAASYGVRLIGDFAGKAERSNRMSATLGAIGTRLSLAPPSLPTLRALAQAAADEMLGDVAHWRLSRVTRQLTLPG